MVLLGLFCSTSAATFADHATVASKALAEKNVLAGERAATLKERLKERQECDEAAKQDASARSLANSIFHIQHNGCILNIHSSSVFGMLIFTDGSMWQIAPQDQYTAFSWVSFDPVIITPSTIKQSAYQYNIANQASGQVIQATLTMGPTYNGPTNHWITDIDLINNLVYLEDGTRWLIGTADRRILRKWQINDTVIIGVNNNVNAKRAPHILLNVQMLNHATASCIFQ